MTPAIAIVAAAMLLAANVSAQCPTCDPNNGAQTVCVVDASTNALQQFISLCEMDLFNCQNNQNVFQPLYYGTCQTSTNTVYQPVYTQTVNPQPVYTQGTYTYPATAGTNYYSTGSTAAVQPNYALSGTTANGDWPNRLLSSFDPTFLANRGIYQGSYTGNSYQYAQRSGVAPAVPIGTKTLANGGTSTGFVPSSGKNGYQAGAVYNFAQQNGMGGGYAAGSKSGVVANGVSPNTAGGVANNKLGGMTSPVVRNQVPANVGPNRPWASNKGSMAAPATGKLSTVLRPSSFKQG